MSVSLVITHSSIRVPKIKSKPVQTPNPTYLLRKADCTYFKFYSFVVTMLHSLQAQASNMNSTFYSLIILSVRE